MHKENWAFWSDNHSKDPLPSATHNTFEPLREVKLMPKKGDEGEGPDITVKY